MGKAVNSSLANDHGEHVKQRFQMSLYSSPLSRASDHQSSRSQSRRAALGSLSNSVSSHGVRSRHTQQQSWSTFMMLEVDEIGEVTQPQQSNRLATIVAITMSRRSEAIDHFHPDHCYRNNKHSFETTVITMHSPRNLISMVHSSFSETSEIKAM